MFGAKKALQQRLFALSALASYSMLVERTRSKSFLEGKATQPRACIPTSDSSMHLAPSLPIRILRPNKNLEIAFDVRNKNPIYVMERLVPADKPTKKHLNRRPRFHEDYGIEPEEYRSKLYHYRHSGFDRGHMAAAADFTDEALAKDTFTLCNVSPQHHGLNLSLWKHLEEWTRRQPPQGTPCDELYVITGPIWLPTEQVEGTKFVYSYFGLGRPPTLVSVPTHFFKVVAIVVKRQITQFACFVIPNKEVDRSKKLSDFVVSWTDLEIVSGLQLFPQVTWPGWKKTADRLVHELKSTQKLLPSSSKQDPNKSRDECLLMHLCRQGRCQ